MGEITSDASAPDNALIARVDIIYLCDGQSDKCSKTSCAFNELNNFSFCRHTRDRAHSINYKDKAPTKEQLKTFFGHLEHQTADGQTVATYWEKRENAEDQEP